MKKKIINGLLFAVALVTATSSFVSCKDYEGDNYAEFQEKYATLLEAYNAQVKAMQDYVLTARYNQEVGANYDVSKGTVKDRLDNLEKDTAALAARIQKTKEILEQRLKDLEKDTASLASRIQKNNELLGLLSNSVTSMGDTLNHFVFMWGDNLADAYKNAGKAKEIALSYDADTAAINTAIKHAQEIADKAWDYVNKGQAADKNGETKEDFQAWVKYFEAADDELADDIDDLNDELDEINERLEALEDAYKAKIDGVIVQEVRNPIFGTYAYPFGFETNILAAYYGETANPVWFPAGDGEDADYWVGSTPGVLTSELDAIGCKAEQFSGILMDETEGNAGQIAMTVNPVNVDLEGKKFNLATFTGNISKFQLSGLEAATQDLYFGHRAAATNGAYIAKATVSKANVKDVNFSLDLKGSGMKTAVEDLLKNFSSASKYDVAKLGLGFFQLIDNAKTLKLGLQTQYKDAVLGWTTSFYDADIAAMSVRPLGYDFLYDQDFSASVIKIKDKVTAKEKAVAKELINQIGDMIKIQIGLPESGDNIIVDADGQIWLIVNANVTASNPNDVTYTIPAGALYTNVPSDNYSITFKKEKIVINGTAYAQANITPLFKAIADGITKSISQIDGKADNLIQHYLGKLVNFQDRFFNKVISVAKNPNRYILPALLASNQNLGYFYPSRIWMSPTQVKAGVPIQLYPTTLTAEVVAPAYKKYVAILSGPTAGKNYNTVSPDLNKVLDGTQYNINKPMTITLTEPGLYEFVFECLGYNGKVAGKKYYIEVY